MSDSAETGAGHASDIEALHHVGHVVRDLAEGLALYRRLGFHVEPPAYPMLAPAPGAAPRPFGAANTHAPLARNFVELVTIVDGSSRLPSSAKGIPLEAPAAQLARLTAAIERAAARVGACLGRFEGLHILALQTADAEATARRLSAVGIAHGGVNTVKRPIETAAGVELEVVRVIELDGGGAGEATPEGRIALAEARSAAHARPEHPNGAVELVESVLCVADAELPAFVARYAAYLGRPARASAAGHLFDLDGAGVRLVGERDLGALLPGERAPALPAFVAYAVAVRDLSATRRCLEAQAMPVRPAGARDLFVPSAAALGAAVIFRQL